MRLEQGKIFPHKAISLTQAVWALTKRLFRSKEHSYVAERRSKDYT